MVEALQHIPVLLDEVLTLLDLAITEDRPCSLFYDGTLGGAGHARALLAREPRAILLGIDRDSWALERARGLLAEWEDRVYLRHGAFSDIEAHLQSLPQSVFGKTGVEQPFCQAILVDLGVSSFQLDIAERGFSFRTDAPLDMRMDQTQARNAATVLNEYSFGDLKRVFLRGGVGVHSKRLASTIIDARPLQTTKQLAQLCEKILRHEGMGKNPATVVFQAIRIEVNDELGEINRLLDAVPHCLAPGGVLAVISFHSAEDKAVASRMRSWSRSQQPMRDIPEADIPALGELLTAKAILPSEKEVSHNPRARSARLRAFRRNADSLQQHHATR